MSVFQYGMLVQGTTSTATAAGTTALTSTSSQVQLFTGSSTQTVKLPPTTGMAVGQFFEIYNASTGALTIEFQDGSSFSAMPTVNASSALVVHLTSTGTTNGTWQVLSGPSTIAGNTLFNGTVGIGGSLFSGDTLSVINSTGENQITLQAGTANAGNQIRFLHSASSGFHNFQIGNSISQQNTFEITPSTAADGTTFTSPALTINGSSLVSQFNTQLTVTGATSLTGSGTALTVTNDVRINGNLGVDIAPGGIFFSNTPVSFQNKNDNSSNASPVLEVYHLSSNATSANSGQVEAIFSYLRRQTTSNVTDTHALVVNQVNLDIDASTGTTYTNSASTNAGFYVSTINIAGSGTLAMTSYSQLFTEADSTTGITNKYGLHIGSITGGSSINSAITTGSGIVSFGDTTDATSSTAASLVTAGGLGVAKTSWLGSSTLATPLVLSGDPTNSRQIQVGTGAHAIGSVGTEFSSGKMFIASNAQQVSSGTDNWQQNISTDTSFLLDIGHADGLNLYNAATSTSAANKATFWGSSLLNVSTSGALTLFASGTALTATGGRSLLGTASINSTNTNANLFVGVAAGAAQTVFEVAITGVNNGFVISNNASNQMTYSMQAPDGSLAFATDTSGNVSMSKALTITGNLLLQQIYATQNYQASTSTSGTINVSANKPGLSITGTGGTTLTIQLPASPIDGQHFWAASQGAFTTVTWQDNGGTAGNVVGGQAALGGINRGQTFVYVSASTKWYAIS